MPQDKSGLHAYAGGHDIGQTGKERIERLEQELDKLREHVEGEFKEFRAKQAAFGLWQYFVMGFCAAVSFGMGVVLGAMSWIRKP